MQHQYLLIPLLLSILSACGGNDTHTESVSSNTSNVTDLGSTDTDTSSTDSSTDLSSTGQGDYIYDSRLLVGCDFYGNLTIQESTEELAALGVDVLSSSCASLTNISLTEACSDLTGEFYIHEIRPENDNDLVDTAYRDVDMLAQQTFLDRYVIGEGGIGYTLTECHQ